ncbi:MAG TPA: tripartite tricarboxylate transporter substrate-binding protein [Micropepsaceae bacterium]|nr:tripartite tricarboxylate transporter substrate-binding protein [Micropepsaceae bacterium]
MLKRLPALLIGAVLLWSPLAANAADMGQFRGKTITYIVATSPGGGYDTYGRLIARYLQKYLTGSRVVVRNVPGAGHIVGANTIYAAKADGLTIGMFNTGLIYDQLIKRQGVLFDLDKFSWIGKAADDTRVLMVSKSTPFKTIDDIIKAKATIKFASSGVGSAAYNDTKILADALHLNVQIVPGFSGNEAEMSMLRNEVVAEVGTAESMEQFVKQGHGFFALALSGDPKALPGVPRARDYVKDEHGKRLLSLVETLSEIGRLTAGPPGIPANVLAAEREALDATMKDPQFLAEAKKLDLDIDPAPGDVVEMRIKAALNQPPETVAALKSAAGG